MDKNVAGQKWTVFAFDLTDNTPKTGDLAQITANIRIDGVQNAVDDTNPTELEDGYYEFDLSQAETNGDLLTMCPASSTPDIQVIGVPGAVWTNTVKAVVDTIDGKVDTIDGIVDDLKLAQLLVDTTIESANRNTTNCQMATGPTEDDALIGCKVILIGDAGTGYVARTITDYAAANNVVTWTPAIAQDPVEGGQIYVVPGDTNYPTVAEFEARSIVSADYVVVGDTIAAVTTVNGLAANVITATSINGDAITSAKIANNAIAAEHLAAGAIDNATFAADVGSTAHGTNIIALAVRKILEELNLDHLLKVAVSNRDTMPEITDDTILANILTKTDGDTSDFDHATDSLEAMRDKLTDIETDTGTTLDTLIKDIPTVAEFEARTIVSADYTVVGDTIAGVTAVTNDVGITQAGADKVWGTAARALTDKADFALSSASRDAIWDETEAITGNTLSFETILARIYRYLMNDQTIVDATGVQEIMNEANDAPVASRTFTDDDTDTVATDVVWP